MIILIALSTIYLVFNPSESAYFPKCPFKAVTSFDCPGCGSQRAIHHLLNFEFYQAIQNNILLVLSIPYLILGFAFDMLKNPSNKQLRWRKRLFSTHAIFIVLAVVISFWLLRNVPYFQDYL